MRHETIAMRAARLAERRILESQTLGDVLLATSGSPQGERLDQLIDELALALVRLHARRRIEALNHPQEAA